MTSMLMCPFVTGWIRYSFMTVDLMGLTEWEIPKILPYSLIRANQPLALFVDVIYFH